MVFRNFGALPGFLDDSFSIPRTNEYHIPSPDADGRRKVVCFYPNFGRVEIPTMAPQASDFISEQNGVEYLTNTSCGGLTPEEARQIIPQVKKLSMEARRDSQGLHTLVEFRDGKGDEQAYLEITARGTLRWPQLTDKVLIGTPYRSSSTLYANVYGKTDDPNRIQNFRG